jgi:DNA polymerase-1
MTTTLLLDADIVAFQLAATHQRTYKWPGMAQQSVAADDFDSLPERIDAEVSKLTQAAKADHVIVCLSCPTEENWRLKVLPSYKGHRDYSNRPVHLAAVKDYLEAEYPSYRRDTLEADDIMGILSTMKGLPKNFLAEHPEIPANSRKVIVSEDKDMKTIPGWLWNPKKDRKPWLVSEAEANWWHLYQTLVGDTTDGYAGLPGYGDKKARALIKEPGDLTVNDAWALIALTYHLKGLTEADALVQARVARICRASDYDFKNKEVLLWTPN